MGTVLITGVRGLIGSALARWILEKEPDYRVVGVDNEFGGLEENIQMLLGPRFSYIPGDILDTAIMETVFEIYKPRFVYHFAAFAAEGLSCFVRKFTYENIVQGTSNIASLCVKYGVERIVYASSMAVYGEGSLPYQENQFPFPKDPYGIAKLAAEQEIRSLDQQFGLKYCIVRPHNVYGPGQNIFDPYRNVLGIWMYRALHHQPIQVYGDGKQMRSLTYIDDILEPLWDCRKYLYDQDQVYNLGDTPPLQLDMIAKLFRETLLKDGFEYVPEILHTKPRFEVRHAWPDGHKSIQRLGFKQTVSHAKGIELMWKWAKTLKDRPLQRIPEELLDTGQDRFYNFWKAES